MKKIVLLLLSFSFHFASAQNLSSSLTACYALDGSAAEPVNGLTGTLSAVTSTVDRFNNPNSAYYFSGAINSFIKLPDHPLLKPTNGVSFSGWVKMTSSVQPIQFVAVTQNTFTSNNFEAYALGLQNYGNGHKFRVMKGDGLSGTNFTNSSTTILQNVWYHVAFTVDNFSLTVYVNGVLENSAPTNFAFNYKVGEYVYLGGSNSSPCCYLPFTGIMDNVRFYNRVLTPTEIGLLYATDPACPSTPTVAAMPTTTAAFTAPDTVCVNQSFNVQNTSTGSISSYYWSACGSTVVPAVQVSTFSPLPVSPFFSINKDGSNYYLLSSSLTRLTYGTHVYNTPLSTTLNYTFNLPNPPEGIWIEKEGSTWYGLVVGGSAGGSIMQLNFGNSLTNMPTAISMGNVGNLSFPHRLHIFRTGGNVYGLTVNRNNNTITRFDFGNSIANTPTGVNFGNIGNLSDPVDFAIINHNGNWYAYVTNNANSTVTRLDFGNSLLNTPTGTNIGGISGITSGLRGIAVWTECNEIKGSAVSDIFNGFYGLSFPTGPTGSITGSNYGNLGFSFPHSQLRIREGDVMYTFISNINSNSISRLDFPTCHAIPTSTLQTPPPMTFSVPGTYTLSLACNEGLLDQSSYCKVINVIGATVQATSFPSTLCVGSTATLSASGASSYTWQPGNLQGPSITVSPPSSVVYTVSGTNSSGCSSSATIGLMVSPMINISATASSTMVCPGNTTALTALGAINYTWLPGNLTGSTVVVSPGALTVYTVIGSNGACSAAANVTVYSGLQVNISSSGNLCNNSSIDLYVSPSTNTNSIFWSGPGIVGPATTPTITVNAGGIYSVTVTNTLTGCSGTATFFVVSNASPLNLTITPSSTVACFPGPAINFLVNASANLSWFPPGEVAPTTGPLVSVSPSVTSTYTVLATLGTCSGSAAITISVNITPTVVNTSNNPTVCAGKTATLSASGAMDYNWFPGNIAGSTVTVTPLFTTVYVVTGSNGNCTSTEQVPVTVLPSPDIYASAAPATICIGHTSTLTATGVQLIAWLIGDLPPLSYTSAVSPTISTTYTAIGTNSLGCSSTTTIQVHVINSPAISAVSSHTLICAGESITLTASGASSYTWMPGFQIAPVIINTPTTSVVYTVTSGNALCSYATILIQVDDCFNTSFGITNNAEEPEELNGGLFRIRFTITALNNSTSDLKDVSLENDLAKTFPHPITYTVLNRPFINSHNSLLKANPLFDGRWDTRLTSPATSTLSPNTRDTLSFSIQVDPNGFAGKLKNSVLGFATDKNNKTVSDSSNNGFQWDPDQDGDPTNNNEITIITLSLVELFIPGGFSPDGDGINDRFVISGLNDRPVKLSVFNRWGNKVYEKNNYDNSWDGTVNTGGLTLGSGKLPEAAYYYILQFLNGKKETKTGFVVIRD